jgi:hypothetical protein
VCAAAQLAAGADVEHADAVAVFLAEQRGRAAGDRLVEGHHACGGRLVAQDLRVDPRLDRADLVRGHRCVVREVEAGLVGVDQRALLLDVRTEHRTQRRVHQVGGRVVAHGARAARGVHPGHHRIADRELPLLETTVMAEDLRLHLQRVGDREAHTRRLEPPLVADLTA